MKYNVEGLREELRWALLVVPRTRGQLEGFEDNAAGQQKYLSKPQREIVVGVDAEGNETVKRVAAQAITTLACRTFKKSAIPLPFNAYAQRRIVQKANAAPHSSGQWLSYCYGDNDSMPPQLVALEVAHEFNKQCSERLTRQSSEFIYSLALLACQQVRCEINDNQSLLTQVEIAALCGKSIKAWEKTWSSRWNDIKNIVNKIDIRGLDHVHERSSRIRFTQRHANVPMQHRVQLTTRTEMVA